MSRPYNTIFRYGTAVLAVGLMALLRAIIDPWLHGRACLLLFTVAVLISGVFSGNGPGIAAVMLSLLYARGTLKTAGSAGVELEFLLVSTIILGVAQASRSTRKRETDARRALEQREEQLRIVIEALPVGVGFTDQNGRVITANEAARKMWGGMRYVGPEDYQQFQIFSPGTGDRVEVKDYPPLRALHGETVMNKVFDIESFDKQRRTVIASSIPLRVGQGPIFGVVTVGEDITQRCFDIEELRRAKETAEAASLSKGRFLAVLSHELRTPLTPVLMMAEAMESDLELPDRVREDAGIIRRHVIQEARLIDDLLDLTRIERGKFVIEPHRVDVHEILRCAVGMVHAEAQAKGVGISMDLLAENHHINADIARIKQVILNLLGNGLKFTPPGGCISLVTENSDGFIRIDVRDTGIGISPEALRTVFNAFEQGDTDHRRFGGLGLGLSITKSLVEMHRGTIEVTSPGLGRGTAVVVNLPTLDETQRPEVAPSKEQGESGRGNLFQNTANDDSSSNNSCGADKPKASPAHLVSSASPSKPGQNRTEGVTSRLNILLVEDHEATALVLARLLKRRGHEVRLAGSVAEALANEDFQIDLLVSDIGLPDGSGVDLIRQLRSMADGFRAIALSGFGMEHDVEQSLAAGFDRHLTKPVDFQSLEETIAAVCG